MSSEYLAVVPTKTSFCHGISESINHVNHIRVLIVSFSEKLQGFNCRALEWIMLDEGCAMLEHSYCRPVCLERSASLITPVGH